MKYLNPKPVHLGAEFVIIGAILNGSNSSENWAFIVNVVVADLFYHIGINGLKYKKTTFYFKSIFFVKSK